MTVSAAQITGNPGVVYNDPSQPVAGEVKFYAGSSAPTGWAFCDGSEISQTSFPDLFAAIGTTYNTQTNPTTAAAWAAPSAGNFRVPDYRGLYLRGVGTPSGLSAITLGGYLPHTTAKNGLAAAASTVSGTAAGQTYSGTTAAMNQNASHTHQIPGAQNKLEGGGAAFGSVSISGQSSGLVTTTNIDHAHGFSGTAAASSISGTAAAQTLTGDAETRPLSKGINYIIRLYNPIRGSLNAGLVTSTTPGLRNFETPQTALTVTGTGWTTVRAVGVAYADNNGLWRLKFNIVGSVTSAARTAYNVTVSGVIFKNTGTYFQAVSGFINTATVTVASCSFANPNGGVLASDHASNTTIQYGYSGDVELDSKPTWA